MSDQKGKQSAGSKIKSSDQVNSSLTNAQEGDLSYLNNGKKDEQNDYKKEANRDFLTPLWP